MCEFEEKVKKSLNDILKKNGPLRIGAAVSGGADSISLLLALSQICASSKTFLPLYVITVNHNIRPEKESRGDADFVLELCEKLRLSKPECQLVCEVIELERGLVEKTAEERGAGVEEAARFLRYNAFSNFASKYNLDILCTAHTKNDQLETILMRFLQGSPVESMAGIKAQRDIFMRPLLGLSRQEIENYVKERGYTWRTDKTNLETDYLRNKIRLKLVPFLDENFPGWQRAVLSGAEKAEQDSQVILSSLDKFPLVKIPADEGVKLSVKDLLSQPAALQRRLLLSACNTAGEAVRIPHQFIKDLLSALNDSNGDFSKHFGSIIIIKEKNQLFVKKYSESNTDLVFSDIIEKTGTFEFPFGNLDVFNYREQGTKRLVSVCIGEESLVEDLSLPFCVRSVRTGDYVLSADGSEKKVSDILSDWHLAASKKALVPVIQLLDDKSQRIKAVLAGFLGYKDWIVKL